MNHDATWPGGRVATGFDEALMDGDGAEAFWANLGQYDDPPGVVEPSRHMVRQSLEPALRARPGTPPGLQPLWQAPAQAQKLIQAIIAVDDPARVVKLMIRLRPIRRWWIACFLKCLRIRISSTKNSPGLWRARCTAMAHL